MTEVVRYRILNYGMQIHVSKATAPKEDPKSASKALKLMHRLKEVDVQAKMDAAEAA